jgi:hypothetical protein
MNVMSIWEVIFNVIGGYKHFRGSGISILRAWFSTLMMEAVSSSKKVCNYDLKL